MGPGGTWWNVATPVWAAMPMVCPDGDGRVNTAPSGGASRGTRRPTPAEPRGHGGPRTTTTVSCCAPPTSSRHGSGSASLAVRACASLAATRRPAPVPAAFLRPAASRTVIRRMAAPRSALLRTAAPRSAARLAGGTADWSAARPTADRGTADPVADRGTADPCLVASIGCRTAAGFPRASTSHTALRRRARPGERGVGLAQVRFPAVPQARIRSASAGPGRGRGGCQDRCHPRLPVSHTRTSGGLTALPEGLRSGSAWRLGYRKGSAARRSRRTRSAR